MELHLQMELRCKWNCICICNAFAFATQKTESYWRLLSIAAGKHFSDPHAQQDAASASASTALRVRQSLCKWVVGRYWAYRMQQAQLERVQSDPGGADVPPQPRHKYARGLQKENSFYFAYAFSAASVVA